MSRLADVEAWQVKTASGLVAPSMSIWQGGTEVPLAQGQVVVPDGYVPPDPDPEPGTPQYPGDPGAGNYYVGWALGPNGNLTVPAAQSNPGWPGDEKISIIHDYSNAPNGRVHDGRLDQAISRGMIPSQSFKLIGYTPAQIVAGEADGDLDISAAHCNARAPHPIWLCYYHEPEDNFPTAGAAADYRAAYRYIVTRFRAAGVTNVAWMPIYQCPWTFEGAGRDWRWWHPDWNGGDGPSGWHSDIMMDMLGLDIYNPLPGGTTNRSFSGMLDAALNKLTQAGAPSWDVAIPEFGMSKHATVPSPPDWAAWSTLARDHALANRVKSFTYWDNSDDIGRYSFGPTHDPTGNKLDGWNVIVNAATVWEA